MQEPYVHGGSLNFRFAHGGAQHSARISEEALADHFGSDGSPKGMILSYRANTAAIHAKAVQLIEAGAQQLVLIQTAHL